MRSRTRPARPNREAGFTLIELMVTAAVVGILAIVAMPNLLAVINANRLAGATEEMVASIQLARSEATRRNATVVMCRSTDGSTCAGTTGAWSQWLVLAPNIDGTNERLQAKTAQQPVQLSGSAATVTFRSTGLATAQSTLTTCIPTSAVPENRRVVTVMVSGAVRVDKVNGSGSCP